MNYTININKKKEKYYLVLSSLYINLINLIYKIKEYIY